MNIIGIKLWDKNITSKFSLSIQKFDHSLSLRIKEKKLFIYFFCQIEQELFS